jgi:DNA-binding MarR family transcriptional regulator
MNTPSGQEAPYERAIVELSQLDNFLDEKSRRLIMSSLEPSYSPLPFAYLKGSTGLSDGNISGHLTKLEAAGYIVIEKTFEGRKPKTFVVLTNEGRAAIEDYWQRTEEFMDRRKRRPKLW